MGDRPAGRSPPIRRWGSQISIRACPDGRRRRERVSLSLPPAAPGATPSPAGRPSGCRRRRPRRRLPAAPPADVRPQPRQPELPPETAGEELPRLARLGRAPRSVRGGSRPFATSSCWILIMFIRRPSHGRPDRVPAWPRLRIVDVRRDGVRSARRQRGCQTADSAAQRNPARALQTFAVDHGDATTGVAPDHPGRLRVVEELVRGLTRHAGQRRQHRLRHRQQRLGSGVGEGRLDRGEALPEVVAGRQVQRASVNACASRRTSTASAVTSASFMAALSSRSWKSSWCRTSVSTGSSARTVALRGPGETTASSPKCSPGPRIRTVATSPRGVVVCAATWPDAIRCSESPGSPGPEQHLVAREAAATRRGEHPPPLGLGQRFEQPVLHGSSLAFDHEVDDLLDAPGVERAHRPGERRAEARHGPRPRARRPTRSRPRCCRARASSATTVRDVGVGARVGRRREERWSHASSSGRPRSKRWISGRVRLPSRRSDHASLPCRAGSPSRSSTSSRIWNALPSRNPNCVSGPSGTDAARTDQAAGVQREDRRVPAALLAARAAGSRRGRGRRAPPAATRARASGRRACAAPCPGTRAPRRRARWALEPGLVQQRHHGLHGERVAGVDRHGHAVLDGAAWARRADGRLSSSTSSCTRKALCISSRATATGSASRTSPPNASHVASSIAGRSPLPRRAG